MSNPEIYMPVGIPHGSAQSQNWRDGTQTRNGGLHIYLTYMHLSLVLQIHPSACLAVGNADLSPCLSIRGSEQPIYLSGHSSACPFIRHLLSLRSLTCLCQNPSNATPIIPHPPMDQSNQPLIRLSIGPSML